MKKGVVALLVILAVIVLVSPGIIRAASFDRGWFSSEGQHRVEFRDTPNTAGLKTLLGMSAADGLPVLVIDTHLDHGLIPVGSMTREQGTLAPGLGSAVSRLSIEAPDGDIIELPGAVYSKIGLAGELISNYKVDPGENDAARWGAVDIDFSSAATSGKVAYDGTVDSFVIGDGDDMIEVRALAFTGNMTQTGYGFAVGHAEVELESLTLASGQLDAFAIGPISFDSTSSIEDERFSTTAAAGIRVANVPGYGEVGVSTSVELEGADAAALGRVLAATETLPAQADPMDAMPLVERELMDLLAAGFGLRINSLDVSLPEGTIRSVIRLNIAATDRDSFTWASLLLSLDAEASLEVPGPIANMAMLLSPQANVIEGFLIQKGDDYVMDVAYKKGVLTVNGAPIPVPMQ